MQNIKVARYSDPEALGWAGWIEPEDRSWVAFIGLDGKPLFYLHRDPRTGAILPNNPAEREEHLKYLAAETPTPLHTGVALTEESAKFPGVVGEPGEVVIPLGISGNGGVDVKPPKKTV